LGAVCLKKKEQDDDGHGRHRHPEFGLLGVWHADEKLHDETDKEEKVKLQHSNVDLHWLEDDWRQREQVYLIKQIPSLHAQVGANLLVDAPSEFFIQLPGQEGHADGAEADEAGQGNEVASNLVPEDGVQEVVDGKGFDCAMDLVDLDARVDENAKVHHTYADDLNRVLAPQSVVDEHEFVDECEDEQREVGRDGLCVLSVVCGRGVPGSWHQLVLELAEYISTDPVLASWENGGED